MSAYTKRYELVDVIDDQDPPAYLKRVILSEVIDTDGNPWDPTGDDIEISPWDKLVVASPCRWSDDNVYKTGETVVAVTATYVGGTEDIVYRSRTQHRASKDDAWINDSWTEHTNTPQLISFTIPDDLEGGEVRFMTQARDQGNLDVETVNSFASIKTIEYNPLDAVLLPQWIDNNPVYTGDTVQFETGTWSGGVPPIVYEYRHKERMPDGQWVADDNFQLQTNEVTVRSVVVNLAGEAGDRMHIESRATDAEGNREYNNGGYRDILPRPTWGDITTTIDGNPYDADNDGAYGVTINSPVVCAVSFSGNPTDVTYEWAKRGNDNVLIGTPTSSQTALTFPEQGVFTVTVTLKSNQTAAWESAILTFIVG